MYHIKILQQVSSVMLTKRIPDDWYELSYDDRCDFVNDHVHEAYQDHNTDEFMSTMVEMCETVVKVLDAAKNGLIYMVIDCTLEGDMNQLDWNQVLDCSDKDWRDL